MARRKTPTTVDLFSLRTRWGYVEDGETPDDPKQYWGACFEGDTDQEITFGPFPGMSGAHKAIDLYESENGLAKIEKGSAADHLKGFINTGHLHR